MLVLKGLAGLHRTVQLLQHYWWGIGVDHRDIERFSLESNKVHSVIIEIASSTAFRTLLLTLMGTPFLLMDSCPQ